MDFIPDRQIKQLARSIVLPNDRLCLRLKTSSLLKQMRPDTTWLIDSTYYCFEYENSARGMIHHVSKYQYLASTCPDINFKVLIIESLFHQKQYDTDRTLAQFQYSRSPLSNLSIVFKYCLGTEESVVTYLREFLGI